MLEEDAAREMGRDGNKVIFRLDRLGIPLVEIATKPELYSPEAIKECALKIGEILRACRVKRGIGTIRQDVNISIKGHERVEIKGFQEPRMMIRVVELEMERQKEDIKNKKKNGEVRGAKEDGTTEFLRPLPGGARMYPETDLPLLKISKARIDKLKKELPKLRHEIRSELKKEGLSDELVNIVIASNAVDEFETLMKVYGKNSELVGKMVTLWRTEIANKLKKSAEEISEMLNEAVYEKILEALREGKITEADVRGVLIKIAEGARVEGALKIEKVDHNKLEEEVVGIIKGKPGLTANAYMGLVMQKLKGRIDARKAMELVNKIAGAK
jgi:Glu-tRNA(Gln) amidotransferase subunit E-like FAD-binding protein